MSALVAAHLVVVGMKRARDLLRTLVAAGMVTKMAKRLAHLAAVHIKMATHQSKKASRVCFRMVTEPLPVKNRRAFAGFLSVKTGLVVPVTVLVQTDRSFSLLLVVSLSNVIQL